MATIYKRGKIYWVTYYQDGRKYFKSLGTSKLSFAKLKRSEIELKLNKGESVSQKKVFLNECLNKYLKTLELRSSVNHVKDQKGHINSFISWSGITYLSQIELSLVERYLAFRKKAGFSTGTLRHDYNALRAFLNWCITNNLMINNPIKNIKLPKLEKRPPRYLTKSEARLLIDVAQGNVLFPMICIGLYCGCRAGEIQRMEWGDWDWEKHTITIPKSKSRNWRVISFNPELKNLLNPYIRDKGKCFEYAKIPPRKQWDKIKSKLSFSNFDFHSTRHSYITNLILAGVPIPVVKELSGHASIETTMIYVHVLGLDKKNAAEKLTYF